MNIFKWVAVGLLASSAAWTLATVDLRTAKARDNTSDFWEECHNEGCSSEEVREMYVAGSYDRESLGEWDTGNLEEDGELARPGASRKSKSCAAVEMLDRFVSTLGRRIDTDDYFAHAHICLH